MEFNVSERENMIKIGDTIVHSQQEFTIFDIKLQETPQGKSLMIIAYDPDMAQQMQQQQMKAEQMHSDMIDTLSNLFKKGGGSFGIGISGE